MSASTACPGFMGLYTWQNKVLRYSKPYPHPSKLRRGGFLFFLLPDAKTGIN